jgi:hypothetical protein
MDSELSSFGLVLVENFITEEEEVSLLASLPKSKRSPQKKTRNNIWRYGEKRVYTDGHVNGPPPPLLVDLAKRLVEKLGFQKQLPQLVSLSISSLTLITVHYRLK